jgi:hypothetical protein
VRACVYPCVCINKGMCIYVCISRKSMYVCALVCIYECCLLVESSMNGASERVWSLLSIVYVLDS